MDTHKGTEPVTLHIIYGCLVVPLQNGLHDHSLERLREEAPARVREARLKGAIIDLSGVSVIDSFMANILNDTAKAVSLLGAITVISGLKPGTAASLVDLELYFEGIPTVSSLEEGFCLLRSTAAGENEIEW